MMPVRRRQQRDYLRERLAAVGVETLETCRPQGTPMPRGYGRALAEGLEDSGAVLLSETEEAEPESCDERREASGDRPGF